MTINDLRCDVCGRTLAGLSGWSAQAASSPGPDEGLTGPVGLSGLPRYAAGVRFVYHPGTAALRDDSCLACEPCWAAITLGLDDSAAPRRCARCGQAVSRYQSLHLRRFDEPRTWRLCAGDATEFLNQLRTVEPKLDVATFRFPRPVPEQD